ncbi:MAG: S8 family serine peptidase [Rhodobacteraceae bacterium]|nr:S8 family serine peptidase [Paracoccaceae bacterium]
MAFLLVFAASGAFELTIDPTGNNFAAFADDDDDDGGDDDDDDSGAGGSDRGGSRSSDDSYSGSIQRGGGASEGPTLLRRLFQTEPPASPPRRNAPVPLPEFAANEIVTFGLTEADLTALLAQGYAVLETADLPAFQTTSRRLSVPRGLSLPQARDIVRALPSGQDADFNHFYRSGQGFAPDCRGVDCPARNSLSWPEFPERRGTCGSATPIGMIDTGINPEHDTFRDARLTVERLGKEDRRASRAQHGTAVAALLVGAPGTRSPGLVPGAKLLAVDAFYRSGADERADVFTLLGGLDLLADANVQVINLSLAGPPNTVLERAVTRLVNERDIVLVAAAGNSGPRAEAEYPAAYDPVIAVTAVDRDGAIYRRAIQGAHIDVAAPGVDVWTAASISGARTKTGTSFAVPFVTAAIAMLREARPDLRVAEIADTLRAMANDLGESGQDPVFGAGLLNIDGLCRAPI